MLLLLSLLPLMLVTGCKKEGCTDPLAINYDSEADTDDGTCIYEDVPAELVLAFEQEVDGEPVEQHQISYTSAAGNEYSITRLHYYLSNISLYRQNGDSVFLDVAQYIDIDQPATLELDTTLPEGTYTGVGFWFGVPDEKNVAGELPATSNNLNMLWPEPMGGGYHFMKLEGRFLTSQGDTGLYATHMGGLVKDDVDYASHFFDRITFDNPLTVEDGAHYIIPIVMDVNSWYETPHLWDFNDFSGVMGNPMAQEMLRKNGVDVFNVGDILVATP